VIDALPIHEYQRLRGKLPRQDEADVYFKSRWTNPSSYLRDPLDQLARRFTGDDVSDLRSDAWASRKTMSG
jgi:hypothetical protein